MKIICAWCQKPMGEKPGPDVISHGMCQDCERKEREKLGLPQRSFRPDFSTAHDFDDPCIDIDTNDGRNYMADRSAR